MLLDLIRSIFRNPKKRQTHFPGVGMSRRQMFALISIPVASPLMKALPAGNLFKQIGDGSEGGYIVPPKFANAVFTMLGRVDHISVTKEGLNIQVTLLPNRPVAFKPPAIPDLPYTPPLPKRFTPGPSSPVNPQSIVGRGTTLNMVRTAQADAHCVQLGDVVGECIKELESLDDYAARYAGVLDGGELSFSCNFEPPEGDNILRRLIRTFNQGAELTYPACDLAEASLLSITFPPGMVGYPETRNEEKGKASRSRRRRTSNRRSLIS